MKRGIILLSALLGFIFVHSGLAAHDLGKDIPGAKDIPGLPRYEGSVIIGHEIGKYDISQMPLGKWNGKHNKWAHSVRLEGRRTRVLYLAPKERSSLEVMRNYQNGLKALGYEILFECAGQACGENVESFYGDDSAGCKLKGNEMQRNAFSPYSVKDPYLTVAKLAKGKETSHVLVFCAFQDNYAEAAAGQRVAVFVEEILPTTMEEKMVVLASDELDKRMQADGKAAIYGIYFDVDKVDIKPESRPQLEQMAALLKNRNTLQVFVVGHTDNTGSFDHNWKLSQQRADAVVASLVRNFGIAAQRLTAKGVAGLAPVTTNASESGRAKNRRVEMVLR